MSQQIPKYKLQLTEPIVIELLERVFENQLTKRVETEKGFRIECTDGSEFTLTKTDQNKYYVQYDWVITQDEPEGTMAIAPDLFLKLAQEAGCKLRSKRNGLELSPSAGAVFSDMKSSEAFKMAYHRAVHPKDN